ncbi:MAG: hypothetical protein MUE53_06795 [Chitinophagales bacterium]|nr:hypothetical protein [Chitinophagales bacterium]
MNYIPCYNIKESLTLFLFSFFSVIFGTVSHEFGHFIVSLYLGYKPILHYSSCDSGMILNDIHQILILLGGICITFLISIFSLSIVYFVRLQKNFYLLYLMIYLTMFSARFIINFFMALFFIGFLGGGSYFGLNNDEVRLSKYLDLYEGTFPLLGLFLAFGIMFLLFKKVFYNLNQAFQFLVLTFFGGILGMYFWLYSLGKYILP